MIILKNGKLIQKDGILEGHSVLIKGDKIEKIVENSQVDLFDQGEVTIIDCTDKFISPGFIDIHSDYIENIVSPRPIIMMDMNFSLRETERILVTSGITTMYHSISLYPFEEFGRKAIRNPENVYKLIDEINKLDKEPHIIHNRVHLRYEICSVEHKEEIKKLIEEGKIHLLSFMDHTPGQGQYKDLLVYSDTMVSYNDKLTEEEIKKDIDEKQKRKFLSMEEILDLSDLAKKNKVTVASHDDDTLEKLDFVTAIGAKISEFPINLEVARKATEKGLWTVCGAPNLLLGRSHSGNLSAREGILDGSLSVISSDYYPSAMLVSLFKMHEDQGLPLHQMFKMVTSNPAQAVGIDHLVGSIEEGKQADLLLIEKSNGYPAIKLAMVDGHIVFRTSYRHDN
ncbi:MAG: alpha-D-ribose 1-methylphosphonate 5-triphosphate diphosphatase [Bacillota bacterium]|nr:alpha-D-ribose 1-methylphosphonate 5-triphosphate diphosphatase [Bacillota bacterium]